MEDEVAGTFNVETLAWTADIIGFSLSEDVVEVIAGANLDFNLGFLLTPSAEVDVEILTEDTVVVTIVADVLGTPMIKVRDSGSAVRRTSYVVRQRLMRCTMSHTRHVVLLE